MKRRKIINGFNDEIAKGRQKIQNEVTEKLKTYIQNLKKRIDQNFVRFDDMLGKEEKAIEKLNGLQAGLDKKLLAVKENLSQMLS